MFVGRSGIRGRSENSSCRSKALITSTMYRGTTRYIPLRPLSEIDQIDILTMNRKKAISWSACLVQDRLSMWGKWAPCLTACPGTCHVYFRGDSRASIWPDSNGPAFQGEGLGRDTKLRAQWGRPDRLLNSLEQHLVW